MFDSLTKRTVAGTFGVLSFGGPLAVLSSLLQGDDAANSAFIWLAAAASMSLCGYAFWPRDGVEWRLVQRGVKLAVYSALFLTAGAIAIMLYGSWRSEWTTVALVFLVGSYVFGQIQELFRRLDRIERTLAAIKGRLAQPQSPHFLVGDDEDLYG